MLLALVLLSVTSLVAGTQCPPSNSMSYLIPHEDCSKFYICSHGEPVLQNCPEGTHFNPIFMVCQSPNFAGCDLNPPPLELPCPWHGSYAMKPHPHSCSKYYVCQFGQSAVFDCPPGLEYSDEKQECVWPHESDCSLKQENNASQDGGSAENDSSQDGGLKQNDGCVDGALSAHDDCSKYNICSHNALVAMQCPGGLHWNSELQFCDWPTSAGCE